MFLTLIILISGFLFACRISDVVVARRWVAREHMTKIGTLYFIAMIACSFTFARDSALVLWMIAFAPHAVFACGLFVLRAHRSRAFRARFRESLTLILLRMKAGKSFRLALTDAIDESDPRWRPMLAEIRELVVFSQQTDTSSISRFTQSIVSEFRAADQTPHAAVRRLESFRDRVRLEDDFRHKSGQILRQIRAQSVLLGGLYVAVFVFVTHQFGWVDHSRLLFLSVILFLSGLGWIWFGGRRFKWKT